jgi:hypothetical protein
MKRLVVSAFLAMVSLLAFAQGVSVGFGGSWIPYLSEEKWSLGSDWVKTQILSSEFRARAFVETKEAEFSVGYAISSKDGTVKLSDSTGVKIDVDFSDGNVGTWLCLGAFGKYPIALGSLVLAPMIGVEYDLNLTYKDSNGSDLKAGLSDDQKADLNQLWLEGGLGADFRVSPSAFFRTQALIGYKINSRLEGDYIDDVEAYYGDGRKGTITWLRLDVGASIGFKL